MTFEHYVASKDALSFGRIGKTGAALLAVVGLAACGLSGAQSVGYEARVNVAEQMLERGQFTSAYTLLDEVSGDHATSGAVHLRVGQAYLNNGAFNKAETSFRSAIRSGAKTEGEIGLGRVALARNDANTARNLFTAILEREPGNLDAMNGIGVALDLLGQHNNARAQYAQVLEIHPESVEVMNNLAMSHILGGDAGYAAEILRGLAESQLDDASLRQNYAMALFASGRQDEAIRLATVDISEADANRLLGAVIRYRRMRS